MQGPKGHVGGKALVEPDVGPPFGRDKVAEPLVGHLMGYQVRTSDPLVDAGVLRNLEHPLTWVKKEKQ